MWWVLWGKGPSIYWTMRRAAVAGNFGVLVAAVGSRASPFWERRYVVRPPPLGVCCEYTQHGRARSMKIRHKGLRALHEQDDARRLPPPRIERIREILTVLDTAVRPGNLDLPGYRLHPLRGDRSGQWSVTVSGNLRIVFRFDAGEATDVDLEDYH